MKHKLIKYNDPKIVKDSKICYRCHQEKPFVEFNKCKTGIYGIHNHCRMCQKIVKKRWYLSHKESESIKSKIYSKSEKAKIQRKIRYEQNKIDILAKNRKRRATPHARKLANAARKKVLQKNPSFKIGQNMRSRVRSALLQQCLSKTGDISTFELLGCTREFLKEYIEAKFLPNMNWNNYGLKGWHIDHIIPCSSFDLTDKEQLKKCFHYTNLQPLWWKDNLSKGNKILI